jgi:hypothetical protein
MTLLNYTFNYALDNGFLFWAGFACTAGFIGYGFTSSYLNSFYVDKGVQTDAWEDYSNRPSLIGPESVTSIDTVTPISDNVSIGSPSFTTYTASEVGTQTTTDGTSTVTTVLPIPPVYVEIVPNPDLLATVDQGVQTVSNPMFGKDWNTIIEYINNKPSFFFDAPGCGIIPDPSILSLISNSPFVPSF